MTEVLVTAMNPQMTSAVVANELTETKAKNLTVPQAHLFDEIQLSSTPGFQHDRNPLLQPQEPVRFPLRSRRKTVGRAVAGWSNNDGKTAMTAVTTNTTMTRMIQPKIGLLVIL